MNTSTIIVINLVTFFVVMIIVNEVRKRIERKDMPDLPSEDEFVFVDFKGFVLPMTHLEKKEYWDQMSLQQQINQVRKTKKAIRDGEIVPVYNENNRVIFVPKKRYEEYYKGKVKVAGREYYDSHHARKEHKKKGKKGTSVGNCININ